MIADTTKHIAYYCCLIFDTDEGLRVGCSISQSVTMKPNSKWFSEQTARVVETCIVDVLEEFLLNVVGEQQG
jgi:hypothetical protein